MRKGDREMTFTLTIELGNDAMQTGFDVADTIKREFKSFVDGCEPLVVGDRGPLFDINGNTVGKWEVTA